MNLQERIECRTVFLLAALSLSLPMFGCGGGGYGNSTGSGGNGGGNGGGSGGGGASVVSMQGQWEITFTSTVSPNMYTVMEANLTQAGTNVFAGAPSALIYQSTGYSSTAYLLKVSSFGGQCDSNGADEVTFDATLTNVTAASEALAFTLTETGTLGSAITTATVSTDGKVLKGEYSRPAACGFPEDHGTFYGFQYPISFSSVDHYQGNLNGGADGVVITFVSTTGFGLSASGTDNGTPFTLTGSTVGQLLTLSGTVSGHPVTWFGYYDSLLNSFDLYDSDAKFLGSLTATP
jgi:hypothetical protein